MYIYIYNALYSYIYTSKNQFIYKYRWRGVMYGFGCLQFYDTFVLFTERIYHTLGHFIIWFIHTYTHTRKMCALCTIQYDRKKIIKKNSFVSCVLDTQGIVSLFGLYGFLCICNSFTRYSLWNTAPSQYIQYCFRIVSLCG